MIEFEAPNTLSRFFLQAEVFSQQLQAFFRYLQEICLQGQMQDLNAAFHDREA